MFAFHCIFLLLFVANFVRCENQQFVSNHTIKLGTLLFLITVFWIWTIHRILNKWTFILFDLLFLCLSLHAESLNRDCDTSRQIQQSQLMLQNSPSTKLHSMGNTQSVPSASQQSVYTILRIQNSVSEHFKCTLAGTI